MYLVTAGQMQQMDSFTINEFGIPGRVLMENAGKGAFEMFVRKFSPDRSTKTAVVAGRGNNGGDGFVIARYLMEIGIPVTIFLLSSPKKITGDARANYILAEKLASHSREAAIIEIPDAETFKNKKNLLLHQDIFIDAIFGTGLNSDVKGFFKDLIELINQTRKPVFSIDIPSGLNSDTGQPQGISIKASATASFAFAKAGHILYPGNLYTQDLEVIDIGIPGFVAQNHKIKLNLLEKTDISPMFRPRKFNSHKGNFGHLMILAGSPGKTGAAALCANAAARSGTGLVTLAIPQSLNQSLESMVIEPMTVCCPETETGFLSDTAMDLVSQLMADKNLLALGPGLGTQTETKKLITALVQNSKIPMVIDADGLNCIALTPEILKFKKSPVILTPHPGEMARLCSVSVSQIQADRLGFASRFSKEFDVILVLKGAQTIVCLPDSRAFVSPNGNPGMASGGMGDVLTGMIAGFAAQGFPLEDAALAGVFIHGLCGDLLAETFGKLGFLASDMIQFIPKAIQGHICTK